jgi:hypothetical protein
MRSDELEINVQLLKDLIGRSTDAMRAPSVDDGYELCSNYHFQSFRDRFPRINLSERQSTDYEDIHADGVEYLVTPGQYLYPIRVCRSTQNGGVHRDVAAVWSTYAPSKEYRRINISNAKLLVDGGADDARLTLTWSDRLLISFRLERENDDESIWKNCHMTPMHLDIGYRYGVPWLALTFCIYAPTVESASESSRKWTSAAMRRVFEDGRRQAFLDHLISALWPALLPPKEPLPYLVQPRQLLATLLPFQQRAVCWMLRREGVSVSADGTMRSISPQDDNALEDDITWTCVKCQGLPDKYFNFTTNTVSEHAQPKVFNPDWCPRGGILAEEMGLGKVYL